MRTDMGMRLAVITTAFFPKGDVERQLRMFLASAHKYNIPVIPYGMDQPYCIWAEMKILKKIPVLKMLKEVGYSHVLYTDARDAFWTGSLQEVVHKYQAMGAPSFLASTERTCNPHKDLAVHYPQVSEHGYNFHCVGGYIAELQMAIGVFEMMAERVGEGPGKSGDDAEIWQWGWTEGWFRPQLDRECTIFQTISDGAEGHLSIDQSEGGVRLLNWKTDTHPCIFHLNGGYSSAERGKWDAMLPWWKRIHPDVELEPLAPITTTQGV